VRSFIGSCAIASHECRSYTYCPTIVEFAETDYKFIKDLKYRRSSTNVDGMQDSSVNGKSETWPV